jgi:MFS family permease
MVDVAVQIWAAPMYTRRFSLPTEHIGTLMALVLLVSGVLGPILGGVLADVAQRRGGVSVMASALSALALLSVPAGFLGVAPGVMLTSILLAAFVTLGNAISVIQAALFTVVIPNELRGLCVGLSTTLSIPFSIGLAPMIVSFLSGLLGGPGTLGKALALLCSMVSLLGALTFAWGKRYFLAAGSAPPRLSAH